MRSVTIANTEYLLPYSSKLIEKVRDFGHFQRLVQTLTGEVTFRVKNRKTTRNIYFARLVKCRMRQT